MPWSSGGLQPSAAENEGQPTKPATKNTKTAVTFATAPLQPRVWPHRPPPPDRKAEAEAAQKTAREDAAAMLETAGLKVEAARLRPSSPPAK
eukprot:4473168-Karenia_brevis.AAC.1